MRAFAAADDQQAAEFSLRDDWEHTEKRLRLNPALDGIGRTEFLTAVSLLVSARKGRAVPRGLSRREKRHCRIPAIQDPSPPGRETGNGNRNDAGFPPSRE